MEVGVDTVGTGCVGGGGEAPFRVARGIEFWQGSPFYEPVVAFATAVAGLRSVFDPSTPWDGKLTDFPATVATGLEVDVGEVAKQVRSGQGLAHDQALNWLCCMLANVAYQLVESRNDNSPLFDMLRHVRHAASHGNRFFFKPNEPKRPAFWRSLILDHGLKGNTNPLQGKPCFGGVLSAADLLQLLSDVDQHMASARRSSSAAAVFMPKL
jgi:hypothetical protein